jgi:hypothetical protein
MLAAILLLTSLGVHAVFFLLACANASSPVFMAFQILAVLSHAITLFMLHQQPKSSRLLQLWSRLPLPSLVALVFSVGFYWNFMARLVLPPSYLPPEDTDVPRWFFGPKDWPTSAPYPIFEQNSAFDPEFNSFGHFAWGAISIFLFLPLLAPPPTSPLTERHSFATMSVLSSSGISLMAFYPLYNVVKRVFKHTATFASSSFCNNGIEWCLGVVTVVAVTCLVTGSLDAWDMFHADVQDEESTRGATKHRNSSQEQHGSQRSLVDAHAATKSCFSVLTSFSQTTYDRLNAVSIGFATALGVCHGASTVLYAATWGSHAARDVAVLVFMFANCAACLAAVWWLKGIDVTDAEVGVEDGGGGAGEFPAADSNAV